MKDVKRRKRTGKIIYALFLTLYSVALSAAVLYGLKLVNEYAAEYEAARPSYPAKAYMEVHANEILTSFTSDIESRKDSVIHEFQSDEEFETYWEDYVNSVLNGDFNYREERNVYSLNATKYRYGMFCGNTRFGVLTLTLEEDRSKATRFDMYPWKVSDAVFEPDFDLNADVDAYFSGLYSSVSITVPSNYTVKLNGIVMGEQYIALAGTEFDALHGLYDDFPDLPTKVTYRYDKVIGSASVSIFDENGNPAEIDPGADDSQFIRYCDDTVNAKVEPFAKNFLEAYIKFNTANVSNRDNWYGQVHQYVQPKSVLEENLLSFYWDSIQYVHYNQGSRVVKSVELIDVIDLGNSRYLMEAHVQASATHDSGRVDEIDDVYRFLIVPGNNGSFLAVKEY